MTNASQSAQSGTPGQQPLQVPSSAVAIDPKIYIQQEPYYLTEVQYERIKAGQPMAITIFMNLLLTGAGAAFTVLGQAAANLVSGKSANLDPAAEWTAIVTIVVAALAWFGARFIPGKYKRTMKAIDDHFKTTPATRHFGGKP
ncbi:hypothetical protein PQR66_03010 [Paraburkholderia agricolaris]|uniref:Holin n=1 Tax=Paraburkholderia agricolaris TaxID=2152888 RepID=A0ABW8ZFM7_9BURK|nr:hypothetical protein [Paraburkholderia agricolaris]